MKKLFILSTFLFLLASCSNESKPASQEQQKIEDQVTKDQIAMDSMEAVIMQQINATGNDSIEDLK